jgi:adenylate kinase
MTEQITTQCNIIITGKPGSGKGTQAALLANRLNIPHISTGDIFREEMSLKTPLGISITESMNAGQYTSDEITNAVVQKRLTADDVHNGFILDGYPRTLNQVEFLDSINIPVHHVIDLHIDTENAIDRLLLRAKEQNRGDDGEQTIRDRMTTYEATVLPVLDEYGNRGLVSTFTAVGKIAEINQKLYAHLTV